MLLEESAISPEIVAERGYRTVTRSEVPPEFKEYQRKPGLLIPTLSTDGETTRMRLRPDHPRKGKDGKPRKYEQPASQGCILDVHPRNQQAVKDPGVDLWVGEGEKKGDSLTGQGECAISIAGVWNWQRDGKPLPCWDHVALEGRRVFVVFDSDVMEKENVQLALERLVAMLEERGAEVYVIYLPAAEDGSKVGVDDFLATGGTINELKKLARKFEPGDIGQVRLSRKAARRYRGSSSIVVGRRLEPYGRSRRSSALDEGLHGPRCRARPFRACHASGQGQRGRRRRGGELAYAGVGLEQRPSSGRQGGQEPGGGGTPAHGRARRS
jgi:hypothetical protein